MSLVGTLGKIAVGVMVAKGATSVLKGASGGGGGGLGGMLGNALGGGQGRQGGGGLGGMLGGALGGGQQGQAGGLGGALGGLLGGGAQTQGQQQGGGLGGLLGGQTQQGGAGGLGGLLDSLGGGQQAGGAAAGGSLGGLLNAQLNGEPEPAPTAPAAEQEEEAKLLIRAMLNAAKCDGNFDAAEQEKILKHIGDISQEDADFINDEVSQPLDVQAFINSVPRGMEQQVYLMSLMAIDLDSQEEAQYLDKLAKGFNISQQQSNDIHAKLGVPALYG